jgi:prolyl 4-hydroxylase
MTDPPAISHGSLETIFSNIVANANKEYGDVTVLSTSPWIVTIDNFVKDTEAEALLGSVQTWERSTDIGAFNEFGEQGRLVSGGRTSSNSWCRADCEALPDVMRLTSRIERTTMVPSRNYESFQILRYELGQQYKAHHDTSAEDWDILPGPRILTMFLYLSDVEEGGHTEFPRLGLSVKPKKGMALLWPGVHDHDPREIDSRTQHTARPVIKGRKYAANSWIHMNDFVVPNLWGCTGAFD